MAGESGSAQEMQQLWGRVVDQIKREIIKPGLWRALERTVAVAWENNNLAVGLSPADGALAGQVNTGEYRAALERAAQTLSGNPALRLRIIEGTDRSDWEYTKTRDAAATAHQQQVSQRRFQESAAYASWDEVHDQMQRLWAAAPNRSLASGKARYLDQALDLAVKAMNALMPDGKSPDEQNERGLSRVIERIAGMAATDPTLVGYLLFERRRTGGNSS
jgi:hypothetical protein